MNRDNVWDRTIRWLDNKSFIYKRGETSKTIVNLLKEAYKEIEKDTVIFPVVQNLQDDGIVLRFKNIKRKSIFFTFEDLSKYSLNELCLLNELFNKLGKGSKIDLIFAGEDDIIFEEKLENLRGKYMIRSLSEVIKPAAPDAPNIPHNILTEKERVYVYNGSIKLKLSDKELGINKEISNCISKEVKINKDDKELNLYENISIFEGKIGKNIWEYLLNKYGNEFSPVEAELDNSWKAEILKKYAHDKKLGDIIHIFKNNIALRRIGGVEEYNIPLNKCIIRNKDRKIVCFKDIEAAIKDKDLNLDKVKLENEQNWFKFAIENNILTDNIILKILKEGKIKILTDNKYKVVKFIKEKVKDLSLDKNSKDLTVEWLIYMMLWEYVETYVQPYKKKLVQSEIFYESEERISIPIPPKASVEFWDVKSLDVFIEANKPLYSHASGIENIGYDAEYGLKLLLKSEGWKDGELRDKLIVKGQKYNLVLHKGKIKIKNSIVPSNIGEINGISVKIENNTIIPKKPIKLRVWIRLEYTITSHFNTIIVNSLSALIPLKNKKVSELLEGMDIDFVWGPPATGKTTYIACKISEELEKGTHKSILILTPTNKSADVVVNRTIDLKKNVRIYRFPHSLESSIPEDKILIKGKPLPTPPYAVSMTIHRYIYDSIGSRDIKEYDWDMIVVDEASMIPLPFITFVLLSASVKNKRIKFLIAGDPNQLTPVGKTPTFDVPKAKGYSTENIYTILALNMDKLKEIKNKPHKNVAKCNKNFLIYYIRHENPNIIDHRFDINILKTQYRSIKHIGEIYSKYMYGGLLRHGREDEMPKSLEVKLRNVLLYINPITIIEFDINSDIINKIHKGPGSSPYHIPSAIFAVELARNIERKYPDKRIGIISPYRMQVNIMYALAKALDLSKTTVSTVHRFQGDERDIIIFVLNPPREKPGLRSHFYDNRLRNVAVSRARDYLIILKPNIEDRDKLGLFDIIEYVIKSMNISPKGKSKISDIFEDISKDVEINYHSDVLVYPKHIINTDKEYLFFISEGTDRKEYGPVDIQITSLLKNFESIDKDEMENL